MAWRRFSSVPCVSTFSALNSFYLEYICSDFCRQVLIGSLIRTFSTENLLCVCVRLSIFCSVPHSILLFFVGFFFCWKFEYNSVCKYIKLRFSFACRKCLVFSSSYMIFFVQIFSNHTVKSLSKSNKLTRLLSADYFFIVFATVVFNIVL